MFRQFFRELFCWHDWKKFGNFKIEFCFKCTKFRDL